MTEALRSIPETSGSRERAGHARPDASTRTDERGLVIVETLSAARMALNQGGHCVIRLTEGDAAGHQMLAVVTALGEPKIHDEYGRIVWDVKYRPDLPEEACARSMSMRGFPFHTDASFEDPTPRYVGLYVVKADRMGGGSSQLIATCDVLERMSASTRQILSETDFPFWVPDEFLIDVPVRRHSVLFGDGLIRYRREIIDHDDLNPAQLAALDELDELVTAAPRREFMLREGELLVFDNGRFLHGRSEIRDPSRHLLRMRFT